MCKVRLFSGIILMLQNQHSKEQLSCECEMLVLSDVMWTEVTIAQLQMDISFMCMHYFCPLNPPSAVTRVQDSNMVV